jgi:hypothetical protein
MRRNLTTPRAALEAPLVVAEAAVVPLAAEGAARLVAEGAVVVPLLQHLPVAVEGEVVPLAVVVAEEARRQSRAPRLWLRNRLPSLLLLEAEEEEAAAVRRQLRSLLPHPLLNLLPLEVFLLVEGAATVPLLWHPLEAEEARRPSRRLH